MNRKMSVVDREREYNPSSCLPDGDYRPFVAEYRRASDEAWSAVEGAAKCSTAMVRYGDADSQTIDVAVPVDQGSDIPVLVFIHGGYWQELSKRDSRFAAAACVARGWAFAAIDYTLAPAASLDEIVAECRTAVRVLGSDAPELGFDAERIFVAGSSAGAHLAAMVALTEDVAGAILVSGIYELEPLIGLSINEALGLDHVSAIRNSPLLLEVDGFAATILAYGTNETDEFKTQTADFARHLVAAGTATGTLDIADRNHFDVILDLAEPSTPLGDAVARLIEAGGRG